MRRGPRGFSDRGADASLRDPPGEKRLEPAPCEAARETGNGSGPGEGRQQHRGLQTGGRVAFGLRVALQFPKKKKKNTKKKTNTLELGEFPQIRRLPVSPEKPYEDSGNTRLASPRW